MIEFLFLDLDDTILDFHKQETAAIHKTLLSVGVEPTEENCTLYRTINIRYWKMLELGQITREELVWRRFAEFFAPLGVEADPAETAENYAKYLAEGHYFLPGAQAAVKSLAEKYKLYIASNGTGWVQEKRMASAGLNEYFDEVFISQKIGANKPDKRFFEGCFAQIPGFDRERAMIVGDSISSDIRGGKNAGIRTCWVNPKGVPAKPEDQPDFEIKSIAELEELLETL